MIWRPESVVRQRDRDGRGRGMTTVTAAWHVDALPTASVAVKVTAVLPSGNAAGASCVIRGWLVQASVAETLAKKDTSCASPAGTPCETHSTVAGAGQVSIGGLPSLFAGSRGFEPHPSSAPSG